MTVDKVERTWKGESSNASGETWVYRVKLLAGTSTPVNYEGVLTACDGTTCIPDYGTLLLSTPWMVVNKNAIPDPLDPHYYTVIVTFGLFTPMWQLAGDLTRWGHTIELVGMEVQEPVLDGYYVGADGSDSGMGTLKTIVNSAKLPYNPPIMRTHYDGEIRITYVTASLDGSLEDIRGCLNSDSFTITCQGYTKSFTAGQIKVGNVACPISVGAGQLQLWKVTLPLLYRKDTWVYKLEDSGMFYCNGSKYIPICDGYGMPVTSPAPLNGTGAPLVLTCGSDNTYHTNDYYIDPSVAVAPYISEIT